MAIRKSFSRMVRWSVSTCFQSSDSSSIVVNVPGLWFWRRAVHRATWSQLLGRVGKALSRSPIVGGLCEVLEVCRWQLSPASVGTDTYVLDKWFEVGLKLKAKTNSHTSS